MSLHALRRTSLKGEPFVGTCTKCGKPGITVEIWHNEECPNVRGTTHEQDLLEAIEDDDHM